MKKTLLPFLLLVTLVSSCAKPVVALKQFYSCKGTDPSGAAYTVSMETRKAGDNVYDMRELSEDGSQPVVGQGFISKGHFLVTMFFSNGGYGVADYAVQGNTLSGAWLGLGTGKINPEVCTPAAGAPEPASAPAEAPRVDTGQTLTV